MPEPNYHSTLDVQTTVKTLEEAQSYVKGGIVPRCYPGHVFKIVSDVKIVEFDYKKPKDHGFYVYYLMAKYDAVGEEMGSVWAD